jgi:hypothetical protein
MFTHSLWKTNKIPRYNPKSCLLRNLVHMYYSKDLVAKYVAVSLNEFNSYAMYCKLFKFYFYPHVSFLLFVDVNRKFAGL